LFGGPLGAVGGALAGGLGTAGTGGQLLSGGANLFGGLAGSSGINTEGANRSGSSISKFAGNDIFKSGGIFGLPTFGLFGGR